MSLVTEGLLTKSKSKMSEADVLLRRAVTGGHTQAKEYFTNPWPSLKERADKSRYIFSGLNNQKHCTTTRIIRFDCCK